MPGRPVNLIEIYSLDVKPLQAALQLAANRSCLQIVRNLARFVPDQAAFSKYVRAVRHILQGAPDNCLGMPESIRCRGINPVQPAFEAFIDGMYGVGIALRTPAPFPVTTTHGPRTNSNG